MAGLTVFHYKIAMYVYLNIVRGRHDRMVVRFMTAISAYHH